MNGRRILLALAIALFMQNLDATALATCLPAMARDLNTSPTSLNLAITCYLMALATIIPLSGWIADRYGAARVFRSAILIFLIGSLCCASSSSLASLAIGRVVQGAGAGLMTPVARILVVRQVEKKDLVAAFSWLAIPSLVGPMIGPPLGGLMSSALSWNWIFLINLPMGLLGLVASFGSIALARVHEPRPLDVSSAVLASSAICGISFGLSSPGTTAGLIPSRTLFVITLLGMTSLALYLLRSRIVRHQVIDIELLSVGSFRAALMGGFFFRLGMGAWPFLLSLLTQIGLRQSSFHSGILVSSTTLGALLARPFATRTIGYLGFRSVLMVTAILGPASIALCAQADVRLEVIAILLFAGGVLISLHLAALGPITYLDIPEEKVSDATTLVAVGQQLSLAAGVSLAAFLVNLRLPTLDGVRVRPDDFTLVFLFIGAMSAISSLFYSKLSHRDQVQFQMAIDEGHEDRK